MECTHRRRKPNRDSGTNPQYCGVPLVTTVHMRQIRGWRQPVINRPRGHEAKHWFVVTLVTFRMDSARFAPGAPPPPPPAGHCAGKNATSDRAASPTIPRTKSARRGRVMGGISICQNYLNAKTFRRATLGRKTKISLRATGLAPSLQRNDGGEGGRGGCLYDYPSTQPHYIE